MPTPQASADAFCKNYAYDVPKKKLKTVITGWWYTYPSEKLLVNGKDYPTYYGNV